MKKGAMKLFSPFVFSFFKKGKSPLHNAIQDHIKELLKDRVHAEYFFPSIGRKADLFWEEKKIVFEVQCSPITLEQIKERTEDYESIGLYPVWLFHEKLYGRSWQSVAERFIRDQKKAYYIGGAHQKPLFYDITTEGEKLPLWLNKPLFRGRRLSFEADAPTLSPTQSKKSYRGVCTTWWKRAWKESTTKIEKWLDRKLERDHSV